MTQICGDKPTDTGGKADLAQRGNVEEALPQPNTKSKQLGGRESSSGEGDFLSLLGQDT